MLRGSVPDGGIERVNTALVFRDVPAARRRLEVGPDAAGVREGWVLSEKGDVVFDENGTTLFLGTKAQEEELEEWDVGEELPLADVNI